MIRLSVIAWRLAVSLAAVCVAGTAYGWDLPEHRSLGDSVFAGASRWAGPDFPGMIGDSSFGQWCASRAGNDMTAGRFNEPGKTTLEQLRTLSSGDIQGILDSDQYRYDNVAQVYLQYHLKAMHIVSRNNGDGSNELQEALKTEAVAQGYLADALSSGHMLVPTHNVLGRLTRRNNIEAHNFHSFYGVFVINSRGQLWQSFGDGYLMARWPSYRMVLHACETSLKELLLVWFTKNEVVLPPDVQSWAASIADTISVEALVASWLEVIDGDQYLSELRLPSLTLIPMPVSATWSYRTNRLNDHGARIHFHYPQFRESGFHDPDLSDIDREFLYSADGVPEWMIPEPLLLRSQSVDNLIREDPDWASVRWQQHRSAPPSYKGFLLSIGGSFSRMGSKTYGLASGSIGYGLWDDLLLLNNISAGLAIIPVPPDWDGYYAVPNFGFGLPILGWSRLKGVHFCGGMAIGAGQSSGEFGTLLAIGVDSRVFWTSRVNIGVTLRAKYRWLMVDELLHGPSLELILQ